MAMACETDNRLDNTESASSPRNMLGEQQPVSKNQQKKLLRAARYEERKRQKREQEKADRAAQRERRRAETLSKLETMTEEEKLKWRENKAARVQGQRQVVQEKRARLQQALQEGQRILIDLSFEDKMSDVELRSLCQQLAYCYHANSTANPPVHLILTGVQGRMRAAIEKQCAGWNNWIITWSEKEYIDYFEEDKDHLVYLTADAVEEIQEMDPNDIYIVGGIVDRNRYKRLCADKAEAQGIRTARLPIGEYVTLSASPVMCTNHVVEIMIRQQELKDWGAAFQAVIPTRKRKAGTPDDEERADQQGDEAKPESSDVKPSQREASPLEGAV